MKKSLPKAIALAASLGAAASAHAVNHNPEGLGQVLLYPVYTTEAGNFSTIHVTNTTAEYKAVKVRFLEGMNSQEVLDFNLYLSPFDVWTGVVTQTTDGAKLTTQDTSCTVGAIPADGVSFSTVLFDGRTGVTADSVKTADRTRVGHIEVIEMGIIDRASDNANVIAARNAILHTNGVPGGCGVLSSAWNSTGFWRNNAALGMLPPTGGLYGSVTLVNVDAGSEIAADAVALDNWSGIQQHANPGDEAPSLNAGDPVAYFKNGTTSNFNTGIDAVSAVLMKTNLVNDYAVGAGLNAQTDFVVTFPTKRAYVNTGTTTANAPFTAPWDPATSTACEAIGISYWDREEQTAIIDENQFSPRPPVPGLALCHETNILGVGDSNLLGGQHVRATLAINSFQTGWMQVAFTNAGNILTPIGGDTTVINGLPAIGFSAINIQNGDVGGLLSNYSASYLHKAVTSRDYQEL
ncbi:hypothetical protein [Pseudomonas mangiferae]|uniref:Uncharacterized protein n=1 Tax=Pseudomonas mangiferae TaxID=2593654 RepID=A0A553GTW8_9PSED|nr:hypothetical protein [Pseudomonas mangiferae]TRX72955.1 hypothetical protein FM069_20075 [Pseudomonas mangiferae]